MLLLPTCSIEASLVVLVSMTTVYCRLSEFRLLDILTVAVYIWLSVVKWRHHGGMAWWFFEKTPPNSGGVAGFKWRLP